MVILTGGAGFIGSCFLWKLNQEGISDIIVVDELDNSEKWKNLVGKKFLDFIQKDDFIEMVRANKLPRPAHIVHMGACTSTTLTDAQYFLKNNYEYSKSLAKWAAETKVPMIYASSAATYGDGTRGYGDDEENIPKLRPLNIYGYSKQLFDMWLISSGCVDKFTGLKFFNVFGPNEYHKGDMMSVVCRKFGEMKSKGEISLFKSYRSDYPDGEQKRDFIYVKDVVDVMFYFFNHPKNTGIYNLGSGAARSWNDLAKAMFGAVGKPAKTRYIEMPEEIRPKYQYYTQAEMGKLKGMGWTKNFTPLEEAVKDYINNYLEKGARL